MPTLCGENPNKSVISSRNHLSVFQVSESVPAEQLQSLQQQAEAAGACCLPLKKSRNNEIKVKSRNRNGKRIPEKCV